MVLFFGFFLNITQIFNMIRLSVLKQNVYYLDYHLFMGDALKIVRTTVVRNVLKSFSFALLLELVCAGGLTPRFNQ